MANRHNDSFRIPYNRVIMALTYMDGPRVNDWVRARSQWLEDQITNGVAENDEALWNTFEQHFRSAFIDTTKKEDALTTMLALQMKGDDLDTYLATFEHLRQSAGWERDAQGTLLMLRRGLNKALCRAIIERTDPRPVTLDDWFRAARKQHAAYIETRATMGNPFQRTDVQNQWRRALGGNNQGRRQPARHLDAMDVDAATVTNMSKDERKKLRTEGRCFHCKLQGHISWNCPKKRNNNRPPYGSRTISNPTSARVTEVPEEGAGQALKIIRGLTAEDRMKLLDDLVLESSTDGSDFLPA